MTAHEIIEILNKDEVCCVVSVISFQRVKKHVKVVELETLTSVVHHLYDW
jgi:hypothetical protein